MRILGLRLAGFGPYRGEQRIDFRRFDEDGIFLITGRTGAGKSSILDAVCFALYGDVPRFERRESQVRSQHCGPADPTEVELEFLVRDVVHRIRRTPRYERLKRTGSGTTVAEPEAELAVLEADGPRVIATRPKDVGIALAELLPVTKDQFLQVVLLAQNRFQEFLLAPTDKRRDLLRTLFGTDRFQRLERDLLEQRNRLAAGLAASRAEIAARAETLADLAGERPPEEPDEEWFGRLAAAAEEAGATAERRAAESAARAAAAETALAVVQQRAALQDRRDDARRRLAELDADAPRVEALRDRLAAARRAERVRPRRAAAEAATADLAAARARHDAAVAALAAHPAGVADPGARTEALLDARGALTHPLALERALPERDAALAAAHAARTAAEQEIGDLETRVRTAPERLAQWDEELAALGAAAASGAAAAAAVTELEAAQASLALAARLAGDADAARRAEAAAAGRVASAAATLDALLTRRIALQAAELADSLEAGTPCPVCGSPEHPAPAAGPDGRVEAGEVDTARAEAAAAQTALAAASRAVTDAERRWAAAEAAAQGRDAEEVAALLERARQRVAEAADAERATALARAARAEAEQELAALGARLTAARERRAAAEGRAATLGLELDRDRRLVADARGTAVTVAARAAEIEEELTVLREAVTAADGRQRAEAAAGETRAALRAALAEEGFGGEEEAAAALLDAAAEREADAAVRAHEQGRAAVVAVLAGPELAALREQREDPAPLALERDAAAAAHGEALAEAGARRDRARVVAAGSAAARVLLAASEADAARYRQVRDLAATVHGDEPNTRRMRLETYVLAAQLEQIIAAANLRLERMTAGRYALDLDDERQHRNVETGLGIGVRDAHTGLVRQAASLSGGEMFLASLALALGLAEVVSAQVGGVRLDTLFVDEGFGSLDAETLDTAMAALDDLRSGGRTIGLISHVESMQERIPARLAVEVLPTGDSRVVQ